MFKRSGSVFLGVAAIAPMIGLIMAAVVSYVMPKKYESEAIIEVQRSHSTMPDKSLVSPATQEMVPDAGIETIKSRASLEQVIGKLELMDKWGVDHQTALRILNEIVSIEEIKGTDLISVRVRHTDRVLVRDIAAEVPRAHKSYLDDLRNRDSDRLLVELNTAVKAQEDKVEELRKHLSKLLRNMGVHPSLAMHDEASDTPEEAIMRRQDQKDIVDAKRDFETDNALLKELKIKQIRESLTSKIPNDSVVLHDEPQISYVPISPNVTLNLIIGMGLGFLISPLLAMAVTTTNDRSSL